MGGDRSSGFSFQGICDFSVSTLKEWDHSIGAITRLKVADISFDEMDQLTLNSPCLARALRRAESVNASIQREWTLNLGQRSAYERLSHLLTELFLRLRSVGIANEASCDFPLTQNDLADATGLTAVHVNRTLQDLRRAGLIVLQGRTLTIPDIDALGKASMFNANYLHLLGEDHVRAGADSCSSPLRIKG